MSIEPFIAFFIINNLRKKLHTPEMVSKWSQKMRTAMIAIAILFVVQIVSHYDMVIGWLWHFMIAYILYKIYSEKEFQHARTYMFAVLPVAIVSTLLDLVKLFPHSVSDSIIKYIGFAFPFSLIWMIYMLVTSNKQQKALEKERLKREQEEELNRVIAAKKDELEIMVNERTAEILNQKEALEKTLVELRSTQSQLIQSEKMASLGELTAGIAHEIQNPLNFVNNFSEVSTELIDELQGQRSKMKDERDEELENEILNDIKHNLEKINHHGKRADAIVKGMMQHSRKSTGKKEPTDINALCDEYLHLSYHGLRAKDKDFNAIMKTDFDKTISKINIVPQDIGRLVLNLINNAFYAVSEKKKQIPENYEPTVSLSTKKTDNKIEIKVSDNGNGIPQKIIDKIFQPFFTTKPTGSGTGLGLSLSYDIIKAHGGEIKVYTKEGEGTTFIIHLPAI